jgi:hypothetical protein
VRVTSAGSEEVVWAEAPSDRDVSGVEGAADVPETAESWPAGGSVGMEGASVIVVRWYCASCTKAIRPTRTPVDIVAVVYSSKTPQHPN